jgi:hypothetical protein
MKSTTAHNAIMLFVADLFFEDRNTGGYPFATCVPRSTSHWSAARTAVISS